MNQETTRTAPADAMTSGDAAGPGRRGRESALFRYLFRRERKPLTNPEFLLGIPLFESLTRREIRRIAGLVHERSYATGEVIFEQGTPGAALFLVRRGRVELYRQDTTGNELAKLAVLPEGTFFGEGALLHEENRMMSARALEPTDLLALFRGDMDRIIESAPATGGKILRKLAWVLSRRLQTAMEEHFAG